MAGSSSAGSGTGHASDGRGRRWQSVSPGSASSASCGERPIVSGLGLSTASSRSTTPEHPARDLVVAGVATAARRPVQERLEWQEQGPSRKTKWRRRKAEQRAAAAAAAAGRRSASPESPWWGRCFNCGRPGHKKKDCTFQQLCLRCSEEGHPAADCKRPRSPGEEEDALRRQALAKLARREPERNLLDPATAVWCAAPQGSGTRSPMAREEEPALCVVRRTTGMQDLERRLQFAMVACVVGDRPPVSPAMVKEALVEQLGIPAGGFSVHSFQPEDFLVVFASAEFRNRASSRPEVLHHGFRLLLRQWTRQAQASSVSWRTKVQLAIEGVPPHAWEQEVVQNLLGTSCAIVEVAPETASRANLSVFKASAWTDDLDRIPPARMLAVPEPEGVFSDEGKRLMLKYKVLIHVDTVEEDPDPELLMWPASPISDQGMPSPPGGYGGGAAGRTVRRLPWRSGVQDQRGALTNVSLAGVGDPEVEQDHQGQHVEQENVVAPCDNGLAGKLPEKEPTVQGSEDLVGIFAPVGAGPVTEGASCDKEDGDSAVSCGDSAGIQIPDLEPGAGPTVQTQPSEEGGLASNFEREAAPGELRGPSPLELGSDMQMILAEVPPAAVPMKEAEVVALGRMKVFCARILKTLAPPLLREVQAASVLRPEWQNEPCTACDSNWQATSEGHGGGDCAP
ncbi:hypothetical protein QYE76_001677 [Lolium multiflorum]|uniref:CCHC-type domain-containing protein n=1 Tax=Lolium multiflorum TaxID=4521 RepID=A0AAD8VXK4_LOLMU|nr:hypothetical protein QYE76_001677 [Lolium multiflorum]